MPRARLIGINHVAIEVDDLDAALEFYGRAFEFELRGRIPGMAFPRHGRPVPRDPQRRAQRDDARHFGLVVDDLEVAREALAEAGAELLGGRGLDFRDPWGNHVQVVDYRRIQFTKSATVAEGMGIDLSKTEAALEELREKGLG